MKILITLVGLMPLLLFSQNWFPNEAVWHYPYSSFGNPGVVRISVESDTVLNGTACKKLKKHVSGYSYLTNSYFMGDIEPSYLYENDGFIWAFDEVATAFDTLYNMNAVPGDRWQLARLPYMNVCDSSSFLQVTDTGTTMLDGVSLRYLVVDYHFQSGMLPVPVFSDTIIERLGSLNVYLLPHDACNAQLDAPVGGGLNCYQDIEINYTVPSPYGCASLVSVYDMNDEQVSLMFPNPGTGLVNISLPENVPHDLAIYDTRGGLVHALSLNSGTQQVDLRALSNGLYTVLLRSKAGPFHVFRWVKEQPRP